MKWTVLPTVAFGLVTGACADISSEDLHTSGICANITASNDSNNKVIVETTLTAGCGLGGSYVVLSSGDSLSANYLSNNYTLNRHTDLLNITSYSANTGQSYFAGEQVTVALNRSPDYVSAPNSYVTLPTGFTMSSPADNTSYGSGETISINWNGTTADRIQFKLNCIKDAGGTVGVSIYRTPSAVPYNISMNELDAVVNDPGDSIGHISSCSGSVSVVRSVTGQADPALDSGSRIRGEFHVSRNISLSF